jgi:hypothetical protein
MLKAELINLLNKAQLSSTAPKQKTTVLGQIFLDR